MYKANNMNSNNSFPFEGVRPAPITNKYPQAELFLFCLFFCSFASPPATSLRLVGCDLLDTETKCSLLLELIVLGLLV